MTVEQTSRDDTLVRQLRDELQVLVRAAVKFKPITDALTAGHIAAETLIAEAVRNSDSILQASNPQIAKIREAREALALHDGQPAYGPNLAAVRRSIRDFAASLIIASASVVATVLTLILVRNVLPSNAPWIIGPILLVIAMATIVWSRLARAVAHLAASPSDQPVLFWSGIKLAITCWPSVVAITLAGIFLTNRPRAENASSIALAVCVTISAGAAFQIIVAFWVPGTRNFYVGSREKRQVMRQLGASSGWSNNMTALREYLPEARSYYRRYRRNAKVNRGRDSMESPSASSSTYVWYGPRQELEDNLVQAMRSWRDYVMNTGIMPFLRNTINEMSQPSFSTVLKVYDTRGLSQLRAQDYVVQTPTFRRQVPLAARLDGGLVGLAGPRGVGKTTILEAYRAGLFLGPGQEQIVVFEDVPVAYEARDFVLHLYYELCMAAIRFVDRHTLAGAKRRPRARRRRGSRWTLAVIVGVWVGALAVTCSIIAFPHFQYPIWASRAFPYLLAALGVSAVVATWRRRSNIVGAPTRPQPVVDLASLRESALWRIENIRFQQSRTYGWGGKLTSIYSTEFETKYEVAVSTNPLTYPELVGEFQQFLSDIVRSVRSVPSVAAIPVLIVLDELDKIDSLPEIRTFINESKAFARAQSSGVLCLMSVSEDALISFEQRGLPIRDSLDSAFDSMVRIGYLSLADSTMLLNRRVIGLSPVFTALCHCFAGGLPRELVRVARQVVEVDGRSLEVIARELVGNDLGSKLDSWRASVTRSMGEPRAKSEMIWFLGAQLVSPAERVGLRTALESPPKSADGDDSWLSVDLRELYASILVYLYFCLTILDVFQDAITKERVERATTGSASFDALASARQLLAVDSRVAWLTLSAFREAWGLPKLDVPSVFELK